MKRRLRHICAALIIICLCSMLLSASAATDPNALQILNITVLQDSDNTVLQMTMKNEGSAAIDEYGLALAFFDDNGDRIYGFGATLDGYTDEICNWYYTPSEAIAAGGKYLTEDTFSGYAGSTIITAAIRYYHLADGGYISIPESDWLWIQPGYEAEDQSADRGHYTPPPDSLYDMISDFNLGYSYYLLDDYNAIYYGKNQGGEWITNVEADSKAEQAGLEVGDLIIFVDGVKPTQNVYAVEYAMVAMVSGEETEWVYERDGVIYTTQISR